MRRTRLLSTAALAATTMLALALGACGDDDESTPTTGAGASGAPAAASGPYKIEMADSFPASPTLDEIRSRGTLVVGTKFDQPLFGQQNPTNEELEGFDTEIARILAQRIFGDTDKIEFVETVSKNREPFIQQGRVDVVIATYTINDTRKELVDFAGPYYIAGQDIMVMADETSITSVDDLNGRKVCTVEGSTSEKNVRAEAPDAEVILVDTYSACAEQLTDGRVDAVTTDNVILLGLMAQNEGTFKLVGKTFTEEPYGIGLPKGDDAFRDFVNDTLEIAYENGDWATAFTSTVGVVQKTVPTPPAVDRYSAA
ncbi:MAG: glutamate ABC transporter substrate-binding protein [Frankia sp.]|nr:glutamate ABC transporter substrate-binding protein [Frankia sp.]